MSSSNGATPTGSTPDPFARFVDGLDLAPESAAAGLDLRDPDLRRILDAWPHLLAEQRTALAVTVADYLSCKGSL